MNKQELVDAVAKETGLTKTDSAHALEAVLKHVTKGSKKAPVQLAGFGTFKVVKRKARNGVNPATGKKIKIPARKAFTFKASKNPKY
ncbi:MAG: HU family DNA-binding protein [Candidatus Woesearchaeota archaeon]|nr:HU family DNA-binding protein [Candidatus Woesearchaeota archaeon]